MAIPMEPELPKLDRPPSGPVVDHDDAELTPEDIDRGNQLGRTIDIDDDRDAFGRLDG